MRRFSRLNDQVIQEWTDDPKESDPFVYHMKSKGVGNDVAKCESIT